MGGRTVEAELLLVERKRVNRHYNDIMVTDRTVKTVREVRKGD